MIKAIFLDFDWTLFDHNTHSIPRSAIEALNEAHSKGIKIILATGRSYSEMQEKSALVYREIRFDGYVTMNGVICLNEKEEKISGSPFKGEALNSLVNLFNKKELPIVFATENSTFINFKNRRVTEAHKAITYIDHKVKEYEGEPVYLAVMFISQDEESELVPFLPGIEFKRWCPIGADLIPAGSDKALGVKKFAEYFGMDLSECMAIGDNFNDKGMIEIAGIGVAMGNSESIIKDVADYVTTDIDNDGIYNALKHFCII